MDVMDVLDALLYMPCMQTLNTLTWGDMGCVIALGQSAFRNATALTNIALLVVLFSKAFLRVFAKQIRKPVVYTALAGVSL